MRAEGDDDLPYNGSKGHIQVDIIVIITIAIIDSLKPVPKHRAARRRDGPASR
jgi:hypothetical protein